MIRKVQKRKKRTDMGRWGWWPTEDDISMDATYEWVDKIIYPYKLVYDTIRELEPNEIVYGSHSFYALLQKQTTDEIIRKMLRKKANRGALATWIFEKGLPVGDMHLQDKVCEYFEEELKQLCRAYEKNHYVPEEYITPEDYLRAYHSKGGKDFGRLYLHFRHGRLKENLKEHILQETCAQNEMFEDMLKEMIQANSTNLAIALLSPNENLRKLAKEVQEKDATTCR